MNSSKQSLVGPQESNAGQFATSWCLESCKEPREQDLAGEGRSKANRPQESIVRTVISSHFHIPSHGKCNHCLYSETVGQSDLLFSLKETSA